jgi:hypothetical protein|tara:strand:+ start:401 stop:637 length:237 start_codon:yes stop_codon:yes gene_type:complete
MTDSTAKIIYYKDNFFPSRPWCADVAWADGTFWSGWCHRYRTKKALLAHIASLVDGLPTGARIQLQRGTDIVPDKAGP